MGKMVVLSKKWYKDRVVELEAKNKRLKEGLYSIRRSTEIMEARRFAEQTLEGE